VSGARRAVAVVVVLGIAATYGGWRAMHPAPDAANAASGVSASVLDGEALRLDAASPGPSAGFSIAQSSLRGTEVDGGLSFDAGGRAVPDAGMRRLFDYYLSLIGERDPAQIRQLLEEHLLQRYGAARAADALAYFDRYVAYLRRLADARIDALPRLQDRLDRTVALRREALGEAMATAFFADDEARARLTLERMAIAADASLDRDEKARRLAALDAAAGYAQRQEADTAALAAVQDDELARAHADAGQRAQAREALWGKEAAERLAQLDAERSRWDARVADYVQARDRIRADPRLSDAARAQALAALRAQRFDAAEQRRIVSLEAIGQLGTGG